MKFPSILLSGIVLFLFTACGADYEDTYYEDTYSDAASLEAANYGEPQAYAGEAANETAGAYRTVAAQQRPVATGGDRRVVMHPVKDAKTGMESGRYPLPADWKVTASEWIGPDGARVQGQTGGSFMSQQRRINSIDQVIQEDILPKIRQQGEVLGIIDLPEIARKDQQVYAQYWKAMPSREHHAAKGIEYQNSQGKGIVIVHFTLSISEYGNSAFYYMNILGVDAAAYPRTKQELIYALTNYLVNPQYLAAHNQREQQKSQASWSAHNSRMQANQRNFDNFQQTQRTLSEIGDISHEGYMNRSRMQDAGQDRAVDGIWEREAGVDPYSGQQVKVESGYKYYYMNQFGEYIGSNDEFYNPAADPRVNNQQWQQVQGTGGGY